MYFVSAITQGIPQGYRVESARPVVQEVFFLEENVRGTIIELVIGQFRLLSFINVYAFQA